MSSQDTMDIRLRLHAWASVAPLLSAVIAPFSVLFDIPALTEPWFIRFDPHILLDPNKLNSVPDPVGNVILSAIGLAFNVIANALLIVRFSTSAQWWRVATRLSLAAWIAKVIIAVSNLFIYGNRDHGVPVIRGEGLWCAVVSVIICGIIAFLLFFHWVIEVRKEKGAHEPTDDQLAVRIAGRHFMINVALFVVDMALLSLLSSRVEHWTYLQGMYYSIITFLTIGFGDFYPTHTVTRIVLFPFAIIGIAQLGNIVSMLVKFFNSRAKEKRALSRAAFERKRQEEEEQKLGTIPNLHQEIEFLHRLGELQEARIRLEQVASSLSGLIVFWVVGAAIFSQIEGWAYGTGLYFVYIAFLTIGYGDFAPITAAGRVTFVLYSLIAVPIMASFAVQAVQQVFSAVSERQYGRTKVKLGLEPGLAHKKPKHKALLHDVEDGLHGNLDLGEPSNFESNKRMEGYGREVIPHSDLTERWHREWEQRVDMYRAEGFSHRIARELADIDVDAREERERIVAAHRTLGDQGENPNQDVDEADAEELEREFDEDTLLTERVLELAISLESRARKLLIMHLSDDGGGKAARIVLKADRNVQLREVKGMVRELQKEKENDIGGNEKQTAATAQGEEISPEKDITEEGNTEDSQIPLNHAFFDNSRTSKVLQHILRDDLKESAFLAGWDERVTLEDVRQYREDFAGLLAAGSRLMRLKGEERALFERRRLRELRQQE